MSTHTNISNGLFPMGQLNGVAMPPPPAPQTQSTMPPPLQQQQQQQTQLQQLPMRPQMPMPNINAHANTNKFMPPQLSTGPVSATTTTTTLTATRMDPLAVKNAQAPVNYLPAHLRPPPATNGPSSLTNGGSIGDESTNSSRTSSPMVPITNAQQQQQHQQQQYQQQQQQQPLNITRTQPGAIHGNNNAIISGGVGQQQSVNSLSGSMQNLNLNRTNGSTGAQQAAYGMGNTNAARPKEVKPLPNTAPPPVMTTAVGQMSFSNLNQAVNNTYNQNIIPTPMSRSNILPPPPTGKQFGTTSVVSPIMRPPPNQLTPPTSVPPLSNSSSATSSIVAPTYTAPNQQPHNQQSLYHNANPSSGPPPPTLPPNVNNAMQQNQFNNNNQNADSTPLLQRPLPHRPFVPLTQPMPPNPMQQQQLQQQQQPYMQAYQQPAALPNQANTGMFNGQANSGPLKYYPQQPYVQQPQYPSAQAQQQQPQPQQMSVTHQGFSQLWGQDTIDLMQHRHILTKATLQPPKITLHNQFHESINCNPNIMRCTIAKIPESNSLLQKSRLPLGILIHPFRDINSLPVIQCPSIVRCRLCRTYINPFVYFVDSKMWKCNLCYRVNELPEDFQFDPATKTFGDVTRRPEVRSSTIEFIAPSEYMLRPPQPAIYLFLFDVSIIAQQSGYLENVCSTLSDYLDDMPGDARTQVGFIAYNSQVHFYSMAEGYNQPHEMTLIDIDDPFLPRPDNLLVNLKECKELVKDLLVQLPKRFADTHDPGSTLGAALQVAYKLMQASGGRVTVFQTCLPNKGPGSLEPREDPNNRSAKDVAHLNPATDFYKRYALDCSGYQIAVDLFLLNQQYSDLATISGISKHSGGCIHHFPLYQKTKAHHVDTFKQCFKRYLVRKIGFEAVMRIRCTRGLQVHTFHGNFFVRSTDLLSLPNVNPDAGYGMQISYDESLSDVKTICFQAALLYTNSEGERRIRVHTLCLPVTSSLPEVMHAADSEAIIGLLAKMAVDRSLTSNVADAREAFINATVDVLNAFKVAQNLPAGQTGQLIAPRSLALMPLYISALLKHPAFRVGTSTRLDDRVYAMDSMKTLPLDQLMKFLYPEFYQLDVLFYNAPIANTTDDDEDDDNDLPDVPRLQLSAEFLDSRSIFLLDCGTLIILYVGINAPVNILENVLGIKSTAELPDYYYGLPNVNSAENSVLRRFISHLNDEKPYSPLVQVIRDTSTAKPQFIEKLVDDRSESSLSYYEFLQHLRPQVK